MRAIERKAVRYLLDAMRHSLFVISADEDQLLDMDELVRQKLLIDQLRDELWVADGHTSERMKQDEVAEIVKEISRTQAIRVRELAKAPGKESGR